MANQSEIRDTKRTNLASLISVKELGGDIDDAIIQAKASMDEEDVAAVMAVFEEKKKKK